MFDLCFLEKCIGHCIGCKQHKKWNYDTHWYEGVEYTKCPYYHAVKKSIEELKKGNGVVRFEVEDDEWKIEKMFSLCNKHNCYIIETINNH